MKLILDRLLNTCQKAVNFANELLEGEDVISLSQLNKVIWALILPMIFQPV